MVGFFIVLKCHKYLILVFIFKNDLLWGACELIPKVYHMITGMICIVSISTRIFTILRFYVLSSYSSSANVLQQLAGGVEISSNSSRELIPQMTTFCSLFQLTLLTLHDAEFYQDMAGWYSI